MTRDRKIQSLGEHSLFPTFELKPRRDRPQHFGGSKSTKGEEIVPLQSPLFKGDPKLEACLVHDSAHVTQGAVGDHVAKIQTALKILDDLNIDPAELSAKRYGPSTAAAVLSFKKKRRIINFSYQTHEDNIVGKMTIAALDKEMAPPPSPPPPVPRVKGTCWRWYIPVRHG
jgi:peptidoglycan hydrolase-like protein with peptidoglycan-binding domain